MDKGTGVLMICSYGDKYDAAAIVKHKLKPKIIIEVAYEEIQVSNKYSSGFGLRFPRFIDVRIDKTLKEVSDFKLIQKIFNMQRTQ